MSTPDHLTRPQIRRDARRVAKSLSQVRLERADRFPAADVALLGTARADHLADRWVAATRLESLRGRAFAHPAFAAFAEMGDAAISIAVQRLSVPHEVELWLDVLDEIADGPLSSQVDVSMLADEWRAWALEHRLIA